MLLFLWLLKYLYFNVSMFLHQTSVVKKTVFIIDIALILLLFFVFFTGERKICFITCDFFVLRF